MSNPVWKWAIEERLSGWSLNIAFDGLPSEEAGPCWSFDRYGRTEAALPDGRLVRIGGEYEDWYDADFYIYNDVIVTDASGHTEVFGYSQDAFPPTDSHTATLVGDRIIVIGNLSYPEYRQEKVQVFALDTLDYSFKRIVATGQAPPWLCKHSAELQADGKTILIRGGVFDDPRFPVLIENIDDWSFDLDGCRWSRLTKRNWPRYAFIRADRKKNHLYWLRQSVKDQARGRRSAWLDRRPELLEDHGSAAQLALLAVLYTPDVPHRAAPAKEGDHRVHRLVIEGVNVRYEEDDRAVSLTVEGELPPNVVERLRHDLLAKLASIEDTEIHCIPLTVD